MASTITQPNRPSLLIVGHGSSVSKEAEKAARVHAQTLQQTGRYADVIVHFLTGYGAPPDLPKGQVFLLPFFMSDGYFVQTKISEIFGLKNFERHTADRDIYQCDAPGIDPMLSDILSKMADERCERNGYARSEIEIILLSHGSSKSAASREATKLHEGLLRGLGRYGSVSSAFLEEEPSLQNLMESRENSHNPVIVLGLFAAEGPHAMIDVPEAIEKWNAQKRQRAASLDAGIHYAGVVGIRPEIVTLIQNSIMRRGSIRNLPHLDAPDLDDGQ